MERKGEQVEHEAHINALWLSKTKARLHRGQDRLDTASPHAQTFLQQALARGHVLKTTVNLLLELLDDYGRDELNGALEEALKQQSSYPDAVRQILEQRRDERQRPSPIAVSVPDKAKQYTVKTARLADYDHLAEQEGDAHDDATGTS